MQLRSSRLALLAVAALAVGTLTACAPEPDPAPSWTASASPEVAEPLFASDEEALAAAEAAYAAYQAAFDSVSADGGSDTAALNKVAEGAALERAMASAQKFKENAVFTTGESSFTTHKPQRLSYEAGGPVALVLYVCDDLTSLIAVGADGAPLAERDSAVLLPFVVEIGQGAGENLVLTAKDLWEGTNYCAN